MCIPKLLYGCEIMNVKNKCIDKLSDFHCHAAKNLQGLPDCAANLASLATIGWSPNVSATNDMYL